MREERLPHAATALIGLLTILGVALVSDRIFWQLQRQTNETLNYPLLYWVQSLTTLLLGVICALVAWYLFTRLPDAYRWGWVYLILGLLLLLYPQIYLSQTPWIKFLTIGPFSRLFNALAQYHWQGLLYASGGFIAGIGLVWLVLGRGKETN